YVIADLDGLAQLQPRSALVGRQGMRGRVNLHGGAEQHAGSYPHGSDIENHAIEIEKDLAAQCDIAAVIAVERGLYPDVFTGRRDEALDKAGSLRGLIVAG